MIRIGFMITGYKYDLLPMSYYLYEFMLFLPVKMTFGECFGIFHHFCKLQVFTCPLL